VNQRVAKLSALLFGSGACALAYQVAWFREFRHLFGVSTAANAAVLAIFMGGLGFGGLLLGRLADRAKNPLDLYARLQIAVSATVAATPVLLWLARSVYILAGGSVALGAVGATIVRLVLSVIVLGGSTFLMGGTFPAAARAVETDSDSRRRLLAVLYGANTLGAVAGAAASTFVMLEVLGVLRTLWSACLVNLLLALMARRMARDEGPAEEEPTPAPAAVPVEGAAEPASEPATMSLPPARFVLGAAAAVGFAFFLMELVWYRMLGPLLGGSTYTFGLILAVALAGIGLGGGAYSLFWRKKEPTLHGFALICALEALLIAAPYALGDRLPMLAVFLRPLLMVSFGSCVVVWTLLASIVVLPAAFVAGLQFPLLVALLGRGRREVGRQVGLAYACNTAGAILGSLGGGFGLLPLLTAPGTWIAVVVLLLLLAGSAAALSVRLEGNPWRLAAPAGAVVVACALLLATGPTAMWRHSPIGAGRIGSIPPTRNAIRSLRNTQRRTTFWEAEGVESSVALCNANSTALMISGKSDGNARLDAGTQVMSGILGAIIHGEVRNALVIGWGTGSTAGWLARVPSIERVDVVELEPAVLLADFAFAPVNLDAKKNPKIRIIPGDAREVILTTRRKYDLIFSEPSNPYRAGVASLFTREFYRSADACLAEGGLFLQWVQAYEVSAGTIRTIYATLASEFGAIETWQTKSSDLFMICSRSPLVHDVGALRRRIRQETFSAALAHVWKVSSLEGMLARFVAGPGTAKAIARLEGPHLNTDDLTLIEFEFARTVGRKGLFSIDVIRRTARERDEHRPAVSGGKVDWTRVEDGRAGIYALAKLALPSTDHLSPEQTRRADALLAFVRNDAKEAVAQWRAQPLDPEEPLELAVVAGSLAEIADDSAVKHIEAFRDVEPAEADALLARLRMKQGRLDEAADALVLALGRYAHDPWPWGIVMRKAISSAEELAGLDSKHAPRLYKVLSRPFSTYCWNEVRLRAAANVAAHVGPEESVEAVEATEPYVFWQRKFLSFRLKQYRAARHPGTARAARELAEFLNNEPPPFDMGLIPRKRAKRGRTQPEAPQRADK
jgi:spermidine synthase/alkylhydroperoxidase family enzyme